MTLVLRINGVIRHIPLIQKSWRIVSNKQSNREIRSDANKSRSVIALLFVAVAFNDHMHLSTRLLHRKLVNTTATE